MGSETQVWSSLMQTFGMLLVVLAFFLAAFYLFRKLSGKPLGSGGATLIRVLSVRHLSPKERLVLVAIQEKVLLLGVTPNAISSLCELDNPPDALTEDSQVPSAGFAKVLGRALKRGGR